VSAAVPVVSRMVDRTRAALGLGGVLVVAASRLEGTELVHLGGGEMVPTPGIGALPLAPRYRSVGLAGETLALPPAAVRILNGVRCSVGDGVVHTEGGAVVAESVSADRLHLVRRERRGRGALVHLSGNVAPYGTPGGSVFEGLLESFPRLLLLQHPAVRRFGRVTAVQPDDLAPLEAHLLGHLDSRQVSVEQMGRGSIVEGDHTMVPAPVTRAGAGALPRWYRRWLDEAAAAAGDTVLPRRLVLTHGADDLLRASPLFDQLVDDLGLVAVDTATNRIDGEAPLRGIDDVVSLIRDAAVLVGATDDALAHALVSRRAEVVQVGLSDTVTPRVLQLAASRGLPHQFVLPGELPAALDRIDLASA